jgi:hypothetical protein
LKFLFCSSLITKTGAFFSVIGPSTSLICADFEARGVSIITLKFSDDSALLVPELCGFPVDSELESFKH